MLKFVHPLVVAVFAGSAFAVDTTVVIDRIEGSSLLVDVSGDGFVSDMDVGLQVHAVLDGVALSDLNADGNIDHHDMMEAIEMFITSTMGDIDKDGKVDIADLGEFGESIATTLDDLLRKDVNADGQVTVDDAVALVEKIFSGAEDVHLSQSAIEMVFSDMGEVEVHGAQAFMGIPLFAGNHVKIISRDWHETIPKHGKFSSDYKDWPENHRKTITTGWGDHTSSSSSQVWPRPLIPASPLLNPGHDIWNSADNEDWPANHTLSASTSWPQPVAPDDIDHSLYNSSAPVHEHKEVFSEGWDHAPGHRGSVSTGWGPEHATDVSGGWYPNHSKDNSGQRILPEHITDVSGTWEPSGHTTSLSEGRYPPNHEGTTSTTWTTHGVATSSNWPNNHHQHVSATWQPTEWRFPPNHANVVSEEDYGPYSPPLPTLIPDGHSILTTFRDIRDLLPIPSAPPSGGGN